MAVAGTQGRVLGYVSSCTSGATTCSSRPRDLQTTPRFCQGTREMERRETMPRPLGSLSAQGNTDVEQNGLAGASLTVALDARARKHDQPVFHCPIQIFGTGDVCTQHVWLMCLSMPTRHMNQRLKASPATTSCRPHKWYVAKSSY